MLSSVTITDAIILIAFGACAAITVVWLSEVIRDMIERSRP